MERKEIGAAKEKKGENMNESNFMTSPTVESLYEALAKAQGEMGQPAKNKTAKLGTYSYKYADLADVIACFKPHFAKHGLAHHQGISTSEHGLHISTRITHSSGEFIESRLTMPLPADAKPQSLGSMITYGRRYALSPMVGIAPDDDDDAAMAQHAESWKQKPATPTRTRQDVLAKREDLKPENFNIENIEHVKKFQSHLEKKNIPLEESIALIETFHGKPMGEAIKILMDVPKRPLSDGDIPF